MIGLNPGYFDQQVSSRLSACITIGGMLNILKVRDELESYDEDPGWYNHPRGTFASLASAEELRRDGVPSSEAIHPQALTYVLPTGFSMKLTGGHRRLSHGDIV